MDNKANHPLRRGCWTCKVTPTGEVTVTPHKYPSTFLLTLPEKKSDAGCKLRDTGRGGARGRRGAIRAQHIMYGAPQPLIRGRLVSAAETALARKVVERFAFTLNYVLNTAKHTTKKRAATQAPSPLDPHSAQRDHRPRLRAALRKGARPGCRQRTGRRI